MDVMAQSSPEKGILHQKTPESTPAVVQPMRIEPLGNLVELVTEIGKIGEKTGEDSSGDWSGSGIQPATQSTTAATTVSARDLAIANIPAAPVMQKKLERHIQKEIKILRRETKRITRLSSPGGAHQLNMLYMRIRRLNALLAEIFEASYEVLKRIFIRVFIDKQSIL